MLDKPELIAAAVVLIPSILVICVLVGVIRIYRKTRQEVTKIWPT